MASNRLKLNPCKSEFLLVSPSTWLQYLRTWWYWSPTSWHHRNLGVHFDSCITMTAGSCESTPSRLQHVCLSTELDKTICKFITTSAAVILVNSFIASRVDYCNSILAGLQTCQLDRIQSALNSSACLIYFQTPSDRTTDLLCDIGCVFPSGSPIS